ncbi:hypothetical protein LTR36_005999 [Oleoguttula mirabilis]|uniref:Uncharacterized protein n=1 Tax=Oleoguttula mirabilis TaxID=1507867 RepID=A0AAV9JCM6_9PEZI|nr:hypothetical protein LTR36_005999 [Oleoguttula mirabilis]
MGRGGAIYLSYTALVLLSTASGASAVSSLWAVSIDEGPAPSPEDGPPFSAHATRNRALLPYQIVGIAGSYVATVLILGTLLLTVGRSLRKQAQIMASKPTEMVKPMLRAFDPSPISPLSSSGRSWYSPRKLRSKRSANGSVRSGVSNPMSPAMNSVVSFDANVVDGDKQKRQEEMERLYAAVMAQDERKSLGATVTTTEVPVTALPPYSQKRAPPRLVTDAPALRHLQVEAPQHSPSTPKSPIRAIYPPDSPMPPMPSSPTSPLRAEYPTTPLTPQFFNDPANRPRETRPSRETRTSSFGSTRSFASTSTSAAAAGGKKIRKSLRHLKISAPLQHGDDNSDGARTPLSPRFYTDPGIPPEPPTARTLDSQYAPTTPGAASTRSWRYGEEHDADEQEQMDQVRDLPLPHPNRGSGYGYNYNNPARALTTAASTRADPTGTTPQNRQLSTDTTPPALASKPPAAAAAAAANTTRPLPLRQLAAQQHSHQHRTATYAAAHPLSPMTWNQGYPLSAGSAGPVKTTFLDVKPKEGRLGVPGTAGLATPYSPYMPYTPLTPVTPHLTSRVERRQRLREERRGQGVITEEDQVADEGEIWSSGY